MRDVPAAKAVICRTPGEKYPGTNPHLPLRSNQSCARAIFFSVIPTECPNFLAR